MVKEEEIKVYVDITVLESTHGCLVTDAVLLEECKEARERPF